MGIALIFNQNKTCMKKILFASTLALSLLSCRENKSQQAPAVENAVDKAESSVSSSIKKNTRSYGNLVHEIYDELLKNNKPLQELDQKIETINKETEETIAEYDNVIGKSETYYNDAVTLSNSVTDSITKKQIEQEIKTSSDRYKLKTKTIKDLIDKIRKNNAAILDHYVAFKIRKTLPEIEKYQNAHPLKADSLNQFINKQNKLLEELKKLK